jgi:hypothetical protein
MISVCLIIAALGLLCIPDSPHGWTPELFGVPVVFCLLAAALVINGVVKNLRWIQAVLGAWDWLVDLGFRLRR